MVTTLLALVLFSCGTEYNQTPIPPDLFPPIEEHPGPPVIEDTATPPEVVRVETAENHLQTYEVGTLHFMLYVDKSGSMNDKLDDVGEAAIRLAEAVDLGGPWTMTFVTTAQGSWESRGPYNSLSQADQIRESPHRVGSASGEQGLASLYREGGDTGTVHIVFSDEDDQSHPPDPGIHTRTWDETLGRNHWTVSEFSDWWNLLGTTQLIFVIALDEECGWTPNRYLEAAALTGAETVNLCADWEPWLGSFTWPWTDPKTDYELNHDPIPNTIRVYFDGVLSTDWLLSGRTVTLLNPPPVGTPVDIHYSYWSLSQ